MWPSFWSLITIATLVNYACKSFIKVTPGFHLRSNMFFIQEQTLACKHVFLVKDKNVALHNLLLIDFEKCHCIISYCFFWEDMQAFTSSLVPNTSKQIKALGLHPCAFIFFSVFGTCDETLVFLLDILYYLTYS